MPKNTFKSLIEAESTPSVNQGSSNCTETVNEKSKEDEVASTRYIYLYIRLQCSADEEYENNCY